MSTRAAMAVLALAVTLLCAAGTVSVLGRSGGQPGIDRAAREAGRRFLDRYVDDGRVVRRDQGGDTVSEGQAYGMLIAATLGDEEEFRQIWWWTRRHLGRGDGLLSYRWRDGSVVDPQSAADADLDAAYALVLASRRFDDPVLERDAADLAQAILDHEAVPTADVGLGGGGLVLAAGPWAVDGDGRTAIVNPSYLSPVAYGELRVTTGVDGAWMRLDDGSYALVRQLTGGSRLPPDWLRADKDDGITPIGSPREPDATPYHGLDAARTTVRAAASCDARWRTLAASLVDVYPRRAELGDRLTLDGRSAAEGRNPVMLVAAAAAAHAAGHDGARAALLAEAERLERAHSTYYGAAWIALGRMWLQTGQAGCG
ncbi:MAG TPA: glycosyl hydrolase family 8 [Euzebyales bacterium]